MKIQSTDFTQANIYNYIDNTTTLIVPITFKVVSFHSNTLGESVFSLFKIFLFWNTLQDGHHTSLNDKNIRKSLVLSKQSSVLLRAKSQIEPHLAKMVISPILLLSFFGGVGANSPWQ
jgi:hypothetical protein